MLPTYQSAKGFSLEISLLYGIFDAHLKAYWSQGLLISTGSFINCACELLRCLGEHTYTRSDINMVKQQIHLVE